MPNVCRFYLKGNCRYGSNCRFEHPGELDYTENVTSPSVENFSFKTALGGVLPSQSSTNFSFNTTINNSNFSGFSFARALGTTNQSFAGNNDIDMSENQTFSFRQHLNDNIYSQSHNTPQQYKPNTLNIFSPSIFYQQSSLQPNFTFAQPIVQPSLAFAQNLTLNRQDTQNITNKIQDSKAAKNSVFSILEDLSETELRSYGNNIFEFRKIPIRPPPKVLC